MKKSILLLLLLLDFGISKAQDWVLIPPGDTITTYQSPEKVMRWFWVDSTSQNSNTSIYHLPRVFQYVDSFPLWGYYNWDIPSKLGSELYYDNTSKRQSLLNLVGDTIHLDLDLPVGSEFLACTDTLGMDYFLAVDSVVWTSVEASMDSVKYMTLHSRYGGVDSPTIWSDSVLACSKQHGFVQLPSLYYFPYNIEDSPESLWDGSNYSYDKVSGVMYRVVDKLKNIKNHSYYNRKYSVGNEFIYKNGHEVYCQNGAFYDFFGWAHDSIIALNGQQVIILRDYYYGGDCRYPNKVIIQNRLDTVSVGYLDFYDHYLDGIYMTNEYSRMIDTSMYAYYDKIFAHLDTPFTGDQFKIEQNLYDYFESGDYSSHGVHDVFGYTLFRGYSFHSMNTDEYGNYLLLYASIDSLEYGTKFEIPNAIFEPSYSTKRISLAPNPARDIIRVLDTELIRGYHYNIVNAMGQKIRESAMQGADIDVAELTPGFYILLLSDGKENYRATFVKE